MQLSLINKKQSMRRNLFGYMFVLASVLLLIFAIFLFLFGQFTTTKEKISDILSLQTEFFDREMTAYYNDITLRGVQLSEAASQLTDKYFTSEGITFKSIQNSPEHINELESRYIDLLRSELLKVDCSGAFVVLNASRTGVGDSKSGVYLNQDLFGTTNKETMLLFRGNVKAAKERGIMPHRKWRLEYDSSNFPNFEELVAPSDEAIENSTRICDIIVLPGTSERVMLVAMPMRGKDGRAYGICGFEVNESVFKDVHAQPTTLPYITCIFSRYNADEINISESLSCGTKKGYFLAPKGPLKIKKLTKELVTLKNEYGSYVGMTRKTSLYAKGNPYAVTVMMPYSDYSHREAQNTLQLIVIVVLSALTILSLCLYFSKRFITPILKALEKIKQSESLNHDDSDSTFFEIDDLFAFLAGRDNEYQKSFDELSKKNESAQSKLEQVQSENERLIQKNKNAIVQDDYDYFCSGIRRLTPTEKKIFDLYLDGKTVPEIMQITKIKQSTLKYHNGNIYSKLGVSSKKQLLSFSAVYLKKEGEHV